MKENILLTCKYVVSGTFLPWKIIGKRSSQLEADKNHLVKPWITMMNSRHYDWCKFYCKSSLELLSLYLCFRCSVATFSPTVSLTALLKLRMFTVYEYLQYKHILPTNLMLIYRLTVYILVFLHAKLSIFHFLILFKEMNKHKFLYF